MTKLYIIRGINNLQLLGSLLISLQCFRYYKFRSSAILLLGLYGAFSVFCQLVQHAFDFRRAMNAFIGYEIFPMTTVNIVSNYFLVGEVMVLIIFYRLLIDKRIMNIVAGIIVVSFLVIAFAWVLPNATVPFVLHGSSEFLLICAALLYFFVLLKNPYEQDFLTFPYFWINSGFFIFFSVTFLLALFYMELAKMDIEILRVTYAVRNMIRFLCCLAIAYGCYLDYKRTRHALARLVEG